MDKCKLCGKPKDQHYSATGFYCKPAADDPSPDAPSFQPSQPPVECEHFFLVRTDEEGGTEDGMFVDPGDNLRCGDCQVQLRIVPAAQWAAVEALPKKWITEQAEYPTAEVHAAAAVRLCARELRKVIGMNEAL